MKNQHSDLTLFRIGLLVHLRIIPRAVQICLQNALISIIRLIYFILFSLAFFFFFYTEQLLLHFVPCCTLSDCCKLHSIHCICILNCMYLNFWVNKVK